jgi:hypothetical protein
VELDGLSESPDADVMAALGDGLASYGAAYRDCRWTGCLGCRSRGGTLRRSWTMIVSREVPL